MDYLRWPHQSKNDPRLACASQGNNCKKGEETPKGGKQREEGSSLQGRRLGLTSFEKGKIS